MKIHTENTGLLGMLLVYVWIWDEILHEFQSQKFFTIEFPGIVGDGIGMPV